MSEDQIAKVKTPDKVTDADRIWLREQLEEYRELLDYLRDH